MSKATETAAQQASDLQDLREALTEGQTVYTILRHVSASGMERAISVVVVNEDGSGIWDISYLVIGAGLYKNHPKHPGLKVRGTGMDMGAHVVRNIAAHVFDVADLKNGAALNQQWL